MRNRNTAAILADDLWDLKTQDARHVHSVLPVPGTQSGCGALLGTLVSTTEFAWISVLDQRRLRDTGTRRGGLEDEDSCSRSFGRNEPV